MKDLLIYTAALRTASQSRFGNAADGSPSETLSGRSGEDVLSGHSHAHYLAIPAMDGDSVSRWIDSFIIWAPGGLDPEEELAIRGIKGLRGFDHIAEFRPLSVSCVGAGSIDRVLPDWLCSTGAGSVVWESVTPMAPGRYPKGKRTWLEEITVELSRALNDRALPPADIEVIEPWGDRFRTSRPRLRKPPHKAHPHPHRLQIRFAEPVVPQGPLCLGAQSHFGLGLFRPVA